MSDGTKKPGEAYWALVEPVWKSISIYHGPTVFLQQFRKVPPQVGHLFAAHWCQSEVRNGGFHQFFSNSTGVLAPEALKGFRAIGLQEWAAILEEAMRLLGSPYPREQEYRIRKIPVVRGKKRKEWDPFHTLDDRFYKWLHAEDNRFEGAADKYAETVS
jgi:hypothetical protein